MQHHANASTLRAVAATSMGKDKEKEKDKDGEKKKNKLTKVPRLPPLSMLTQRAEPLELEHVRVK